MRSDEEFESTFVKGIACVKGEVWRKKILFICCFLINNEFSGVRFVGLRFGHGA